MTLMDHLPAQLFAIDPLYFKAAAWALLTLVVCAYVTPYIVDSNRLRSYPGPLLACLSPLWYARVSWNRTQGSAVRRVHEEYGTPSYIQSTC